jgi:hypothetical protein
LTRTTIAILVLLALALGAGTVAVQSHTVTGPVYTVAQLQEGFTDHPRTWIGRSVRVRGNVRQFPVMCSSGRCQPQTHVWLVMEVPWPRGSQGPWDGLVLAPGPAVRLMDALAHLPFVARYLSDRLLTNGVHRLRLVSAHRCFPMWPSSCVNAVLLDP